MKIVRTSIAILALLATFSGCECNDTPIENIEIKVENPSNYKEKQEVVKAEDLTPAKEVIPFVELEAPVDEAYENVYKVYESLVGGGYSEIVACGVIGNMMVECGNQTLELNHTAFNPEGDYYGLCQWSAEYYPEVVGSKVEYQIEFLLNNIEEEFHMFATAFSTSYEEFVAIEDVEEAAYRFAQVYERCDPSTYEYREVCAVEAYKYFCE